MAGGRYVSRNRRTATGLTVRIGEDGVRVTTRHTFERIVFTLLLAAVALVWWFCLRGGVFGRMDLFGQAMILATLFAPVFVLGAFLALPDQRLVVSRLLREVRVQRRWLFVPIWTTRVDLDDCYGVRAVQFHTKETVEGGVSAASTVAISAMLLPVGGFHVGTETHDVVVPLYALEVVRPDGSSIVTHLSRDVADCEMALGVIWRAFPELAPKPPAAAESEQLAVGTRIRVRPDADWARLAVGAVAQPPPTLARYGGYGSRPCRIEGGRGLYWIEFDEPQTEPGGERPVRSGEIDWRSLEPL